jgi:hypothetical protein
MAIMPLPCTTMLFQKLRDCGYINPDKHKECLWPGAAVIISSNDSATDIQEVRGCQCPQPFIQRTDEQHCFQFQNPPPFWRLPASTMFVPVQSDQYCRHPMYAEVGPARKGFNVRGKTVCDDVERMLLVNMGTCWVLLYPSLRGHDKSASIAYSSSSDLATCDWFVGVNPLLGSFELRANMRLVSTEDSPRCRIPSFGWENYALGRQKQFQHAATTANPGGCQQQTTHSDNRRFGVAGFVHPVDPSKLNQDNETWQSAAEWANVKTLPVPAPPGWPLNHTPQTQYPKS